MKVEITGTKTIHFARIVDITEERFQALSSGDDIMTNWLRDKDEVGVDEEWITSDIQRVEE